MYQNTITLFSRKPGGSMSGDTWYPTVIRNVNLQADRAAILAKYGPESKDGAYLGIHYQKSDGAIMVSGKPYMKPKEWDKTEDSITFSTDDFFWEGEWTGGIVTDADYSTEGFYGYLNRTRDNVFAVSSVAIHSAIPLIEIMGR